MNELEQKAADFAVRIRKFIKTLPSTLANYEDVRQLIKSSGSIGANYIESNEALSKKDRVMRLKISRKEAKETAFWINTILKSNELQSSVAQSGESLLGEANELKNILSAIIIKTETREKAT
ncbi:MAG: four helix bundle protein [Bacteroidales bacterium]|nr:four helix bundle protein [Lentimicrobiaceae bacterium]MDD5694932.1 four helix bundle protein [Bacteroidales bacterium]